MHEATERITKAINVNKELLTPREVELLETWLQSAIGDGLKLLENFVKAFAEELVGDFAGGLVEWITKDVMKNKNATN